MKKITDELAEMAETPVKEIKKTNNEIILNKELLPSRGKFYPGDIRVRKLNAKEIKDLSTMKPHQANGIFNAIIADCVKGIELEDILINDKLWLVYYLRSITFNDMPFPVKVQCPKCGRTTNQMFTLNRLLVNYGDTPLPKEITLPNGDVIEPCWPTIGDEMAINRLKNDPSTIEIIDEEIATICAHIKTLNGKKMDLFTAYGYFTAEDSRGSGLDFAAFCQKLKPATFNARPIFTTNCVCGEEVYSEITLNPSFFLPTF